MKLHIPLHLRRRLLASMLAVVSMVITEPAQAGVMHTDVVMHTYMDFGQNRGRYVVGNRVNALLEHIREQEGGIGIHYTDGTPSFYISNEQGMISYRGTGDIGAYAAIAPSSIVTVAHNGSISASYGEREVGVEHALNYQPIDIRYTGFRLTSPGDYMLQRQSKIQVDTTWNPLSNLTEQEKQGLVGEYVYHSGSGIMGMWEDGKEKRLAGGYAYIIGGIHQTTDVTISDDDRFVARQNMYYSENCDGASLERPLPNAIRVGDSGSPTYRYNNESGQYEYLGTYAVYSGTSTNWSLGYSKWALETLASFDRHVDMSTVNTVYLNAVNKEVGDVTNGTYTNKMYAGEVMDGNGNVLQTHKGLQTGLNTWKDMSALRDTQNWYAYDASNSEKGYLNARIEDLYHTENLVFDALSGTQNRIVLNDTVDLGVGYAEFNGGNFVIESETGEKNRFNHAGYVINDGASVHLKLVNPSDHMTEWRKMGTGDLYIDGTGDTNALLNVGGAGKIYLQQNNGYAAYNVLVNTGATVIIQDVNQIKRDFTFGAGGGVLDMYGNTMDWYMDEDADDRFTINALTEEAVITNTAPGKASLTYRQAGDTTYLGSFTGNLDITYDGGSGSTWELHSIHTKLDASSAFNVNSGKVILVGSLTEHGKGSASSYNAARLERSNDWHYADAEMNVNVRNGGTLELGSHARLTGNVTVDSGGTYLMREGVQHAYEYVEGGAYLEETARYADFYGHKGNVILADGGTMQVEYNEGVTACGVYGGNISGEGGMSVNLRNPYLTLTLTGNNTFTGEKRLISGGLIGGSCTAFGHTSENKWVVEADGWVASHTETGSELLEHVSTTSSGTLALSADTTEQLDLQNYTALYLGAEVGKKVAYGTNGTEEELRPVDGAWRLGGGGGDLEVHYRLTGESDLQLGANEKSRGNVHLTNGGNDFTGDVVFNGTGICLSYDAGALGQSNVALSYGNSLTLAETGDIERINSDSEGIILTEKTSDSVYDMRKRPSIALGASVDTTFTGDITVDDGQVYRFSSADGATFTVDSTLKGGHDIVVDAQGRIGGTVVLKGAEAVDGTVTVMGHRDGNGGDITLGFDGDNALRTVSATVVKNGGIVDVGDTNQILNNVSTEAGGLLKGSDNGTLVFRQSEEKTLLGGMKMGNVLKEGAANLSLSSTDNSWILFTVKEGELSTIVNNTLSATGITRVESGAVLNMSAASAERTMCGNVVLAEGGKLISGGNCNVYFTGSVSAAAGEKGAVEGESHWYFDGAANNVNGGTLDFRSQNLYLRQKFAQYIGGTLAVGGDSLTLYSDGAATDMLKHLNHIDVAQGKTLKFEDRTWNTIWQLDCLTGKGSITWNSDTTHSKTARMIIGGEGEYSGDFYYNRNYSAAARVYQSFLQLDSEKAMSGATLHMNGVANSFATLALNANRVQLGGINGDEHSYIMAGAAPADSASTEAPESTRHAVLVLSGAGEYTYRGNIGKDGNVMEAAVSLEMSGIGTHTFNGECVVLKDVSALQGTLNIDSDNLTVSGDVTVGRGATLNMGESHSLDVGRSFHVVAGGSASAVFTPSLVLNGGSLSFDGYALSDTPALHLERGVSVNGVCSQQIEFTRTSAINAGVNYSLADGNWSALDGKMTAVLPEYLNAQFSNSAEGLSVSFCVKDGYSVWQAEGSGGTWSATSFGSGDAVPTTDVAVFNDVSQAFTVNITGDVSVSKVLVNSENEYSFVSVDGRATVSALELNGGGTTILNKGAMIVSGETVINGGTLLVKEDYAKLGTVSGSGTLAIGAWNVSPNIVDLNTLHILEGCRYNGNAAGAENIIIDVGGSYSQGVNQHYSGNIVSNGGRIEMLLGSLSGTITLNGNTELNLFTGTADLKSSLIQNGYTLTQTGYKGTVQISSAAPVVLEDYVVQVGTLKYTGRTHTAGILTAKADGTILVGNGVTLNASGINPDGGKVVVGNSATLNVTNSMDFGSSQTSLINVSEGGKLKFGGISIHGSSSATVSGRGQYDLQSEEFTITDAQIEKTKAKELSVGNKLVNANVQNSYSGQFHLTNTQNTYNGIYAMGGDVQVTRDSAFELKELAVAGGKSFIAGTERGDVIDVSVNGIASFADGARVTANLTLSENTILDVSGAITLNGSLSVAFGVQLAGGNYERLFDMEKGESLVIFEGLNSLILGEIDVPWGEITTLHGIGANAFFTNLPDDVLLVYSLGKEGQNSTLSLYLREKLDINDFNPVEVNLQGALSGENTQGYTGYSINGSKVTLVPEPATATLSLLALSMLVARRRRK